MGRTHRRYGDVFVDSDKSTAVYRDRLALTRTAPGPGNLRRPIEPLRAYRPAPEIYRVPERAAVGPAMIAPGERP